VNAVAIGAGGADFGARTSDDGWLTSAHGVESSQQSAGPSWLTWLQWPALSCAGIACPAMGSGCIAPSIAIAHGWQINAIKLSA
jgi:hypothetical protein